MSNVETPPRPHAASISNERQVAAVERLIEDLRWARNDSTQPEYETFHALRAVVARLKAHIPAQSENTRRGLGRRVATAVRSKDATGWNMTHLAQLGLELVSRWAVVEQALERFENELETGQR